MALPDYIVDIGRAWLAQDCLLCGGASGQSPLCRGCGDDLQVLSEHCPRCALSSAGGRICGACLARPPSFDRTVAVWQYAFPCDRLLQSLKYRGRLPLARFFATGLATRAGDGVDCLVPMPLHRRRLAERGFNQSAEIARELSRLTGIPWRTDIARRVKDTLAQADLPYRDRARNVRGAFGCRQALKGERIAVVDDIMTTGATLEALARSLKRAGAARVENWIVARTLLD